MSKLYKSSSIYPKMQFGITWPERFLDYKKLFLVMALLVSVVVTSNAQTVTITGQPQIDANVSPGFRNRVLYKFKLVVTRGTAVLNGISGITTSGNYQASDITPSTLPPAVDRGFRLQYFSNTGLNNTPSYVNFVNTLDNVVGGNAIASISGTGAGQTISKTINALSLPEGIHWLILTVDIAPEAAIGRTLGLNAFDASVFQFAAGTTVVSQSFSAPGLQTFKAANLSVSGFSPVASTVEKSNNHFILYRVDVTATGAATQIGDGHGTTRFEFGLEGTGIAPTGANPGTTFGNFRYVYSEDQIFDGTDQLVGNSIVPNNALINGDKFPLGIGENTTRSFFLTTNIPSTAVTGATVKVSSVFMNAPAGTTISGLNNLPAGNFITVAALNTAKVSLVAYRENNGPLLQGSLNNHLGYVKVSVADASTTLTKISMTAMGVFTSTDYTSIKLWVSDNPVFDKNNALFVQSFDAPRYVGNGRLLTSFPGVGQVASTIKYSPLIEAGAVRYIHYTVDIAPTAMPGNTIGMSYTQDFDFNANNTAIAGLRTYSGMSGAHRIIGSFTQVNVSSLLNSNQNPAKGSLNEVLYKLKTVIRNSNTSFNSVTLNVNTSSFSNIGTSGYKLYSSSSSSFSTATATQFGSAVTASANSQDLTFTAASPLDLIADQEVYFYLVADINSSAATGNTIQVSAPDMNAFNISTGQVNVTATAVTHTISAAPAIVLSAGTPVTENLAAGTKNAIIYQLNMQAGNADAKFTQATFTTSGSASTISYRLYSSTDGLFDKTDVQVGATLVKSGSNQTMLFVPSIPIGIDRNATATLFLIADVPTSTTSGTVSISAPVLSQVQFAVGSVQQGTNPNPPASAVKTVVSRPTVNVSSASAVNLTLAAGTRDFLAYRGAITLTGTTAYANLKSIGIQTKNTFKASDVSSGFKFYLSTNNNIVDNADKFLGTVGITTTPEMLTLTLPEVVRINPAVTTYLLITTDISQYAQVGSKVQLEKLLGTNLIFEANNPQFIGTNSGDGATITVAAPSSFAYAQPGPSTMPCSTPTNPVTLPSKVVNIVNLGADPTGQSNSNAAFKAAVAKGSTFVYIPNGTYLLTESISWSPEFERASPESTGASSIEIWGESREGVIIKLADNAPGFGDPSRPKYFLRTGTGSPDRFRNSMNNITIEIGSGNAGAIALQHFTNNLGGMYNMTIKAAPGSGYIGLDKAYNRAMGPDLMKDILIDGFETGIKTGYSVESETFEHITLQNQRKYGFYNTNQILSIRDLKVLNCGGPGFVNESGHVTLLDGNFNGGDTAALVNGAGGKLFVRNLQTSGYTKAISDPDSPVTGTTISEYTSNPVIGRDGVEIAASSLNLPVKETPVIPWDNPSTWVNVEDFGATNGGNCGSPSACFPCDDDAPAVQRAIDATLSTGTRPGATTLFLPGSYRLHSTIYLRGSIRRIVSPMGGMGGPTTGIIPGGEPLPVNWIVEGGTYPEIEIMDGSFNGQSTTNQCRGCRGTTTFENNSGRTLIFKNCGLGTVVFNGGEVFIESCSFAQDGILEFNNANAWARQLDPEREAAKVSVNGGTFWCLGLKTEGHGEIIIAKNNAKVEVYGGFIYSLSDSRSEPMFHVEDSEVSLNFFEYASIYGRPYLTVIEDVKQGNIAKILRGADAPGFTHNPANIAQIPTFPATWSQRTDNTTFTNASRTVPNYDGVLGTDMVLYVNRSSTDRVDIISLGVSPISASIPVGAIQQLTALVGPTNSTNKTVTWSSSSTSIATVDVNGLVTATSVGSATITASITDNGITKTATSIITVTAGSGGGTSTKLAGGIGYIWRELPDLYSNDNKTAPSPNRITDGDLNTTFYLDDNNSEFSYQAAGITWTTAQSNLTSVKFYHGTTTNDGGAFTPNGSNGVRVQYTTNGTTWTDAPGWTVAPGYDYATSLPMAASNKTYTFSGTSPITSFTGIRVVGPVHTNDISWAVYVKEVEAYTGGGGGSTGIAVTSIKVLPSSAYIPANSTKQLYVDIQPANATNKTINWSSSNTSIASVDANGVVTAGSTVGGTAVITATTADGSNKTSTSQITVTTGSGASTALAGTGYIWFNMLGSSTLDETKQLNQDVADGDLSDNVKLPDAGEASWQAAGMTFTSSQAGINKVEFYNGTMLNNGSENGNFTANIKVQYKDAGTGTWTDAPGWSIPSYPYNDYSASGQTYTFTGANLPSASGVRVVGQVRTSDVSWAIHVREVKAYIGGSGTVINVDQNGTGMYWKNLPNTVSDTVRVLAPEIFDGNTSSAQRVVLPRNPIYAGIPLRTIQGAGVVWPYAMVRSGITSVKFYHGTMDNTGGFFTGSIQLQSLVLVGSTWTWTNVPATWSTPSYPYNSSASGQEYTFIGPALADCRGIRVVGQVGNTGFLVVKEIEVFSGSTLISNTKDQEQLQLNQSTIANASDKITVFPNPVTDGWITINFAAQDSRNNVAVALADLSGRIVYRSSFLATGNSQRINVGNVQPGLYVLQITGATSKFSTKIIVE